jgi:SAM-dependent methyltransferase
MYIVDRSMRFVRGFLLSYGPQMIKRRFWDSEFSEGKWNFIDNTTDDCVYPHLEKFAQKGNILDLGCGPGNTATELAADAYSNYMGVDISGEALAKAARRTEASGRTTKNRFARCDFLAFEPSERFDVILFRESMYHIPIGKIRPILDKYSPHLTDKGVFIVRLYTSENGKPKWRPTKMIEMIQSAFDTVEKYHDSKSGATIIVFRPWRAVVNS